MSKTEVILEADLPINETTNVTVFDEKYDLYYTETSTQLSIINDMTTIVITADGPKNNQTLMVTSSTVTEQVRWFTNYKGKLIKVRQSNHRGDKSNMFMLANWTHRPTGNTA